MSHILFCLTKNKQNNSHLFAVTQPNFLRHTKKISGKYLMTIFGIESNFKGVTRLFCTTVHQADTHVAGIFLSLLCETVTRSDHCREASFPPLLLVLLSVGDLQTREELSTTSIQEFSSLTLLGPSTCLKVDKNKVDPEDLATLDLML